MSVRGKRALLVVDDDPEMRAYVRRVVIRLCAFVETIHEAESGWRALDRVREGNIDLLVADIQLPGLDGIALCRALESDPALGSFPVLLISGDSSRTGDAHEFATSAGHRAFLPKPFNARELSLALTALVESSENG